MKHRVIGIDLGTTYSSVAAYDNDEEQALIFDNPESGGERTTPSVVGLHKGTRKVIVGRAATQNLAADPLNTIIELNREMGEVFAPEKHAGRPGIDVGKPVKVRFAQFPDQWYLPQEISSFILMKMKEVAEYHIGEEIRDAVVTVPAYFHATQKKATEQAALLAGLYPRQLIPESTAAAICFGVDRYDPEQHVYMVYDLGGGAFDVSIIDVQAERINVVATAGEPRLGGSDFDDAITTWAIAELQNKYDLDFSNDPEAQAAIKYEAEQAKIRLSDFETTDLHLANLKPQVTPVLELTRNQFEQLINDHLSRSMNALELALEYAGEKGYRREDVSAILLVGGSSNIPVVRAMLMDYFGQGEEFVRGDLDPASVVARGAAILAKRYLPTDHAYDVRRRPDATLIDESSEEDLMLSLITEHSLGMGVQGGRVIRLIERGQNLPTSCTFSDFVSPGPVEYVRVPIYQGEDEYTFENTLIGEVEIGPLQPLPAGSHQFEVTFTLDVDGLLHVNFKNLETGTGYQASFEHDTSMMSDDALDAVRGKLLNCYQPMFFAAEKEAAAATAPESPGFYVPPPPPGAAEVEQTSKAAASPETPAQPHLPTTTVDRVHFAVTSPSQVQPGASFLLDLWAYLAEQREEVVRRAQEEYASEKIHIKSKGPVKVARGTVLTVRLDVAGLMLEAPEDDVLWEGEIGNATFAVTVPADAEHGERLGTARIYADGVQIARVHFVILVADQITEPKPLPVNEVRYTKAFASYASADRDAVLGRIHGMQKVAPQLEIFLDVCSLRSGQDWEKELWKAIPEHDVFYLFWSEHAARSEWVEKEWRCALETRGSDFIDPMPLVTPDEVPPPSELAHKHFNDWILAFQRGRRINTTDM